MIILKKGDKPAILAKNYTKWTTELEAEILDGGDKVTYRSSKYNAKKIKEALQQEVHGKCAYCESKFLSVTYGDVEHIVPKSSDVKMTFEWCNLTLACDRCNTNKGDKIGLFDPYENDPEEHFEFFGPTIRHKDGRDIAELTHIELKLNRVDLLEKRHEKLLDLANHLERLGKNPDQSTRTLLVNAVKAAASAPDSEFSACLKSLIRAKRQREQNE